MDTSQASLTIPIEDLATFTYQNIRLGLVYGSQLGLTSLMLITLLLLTQSGKRSSPIYMLNVLALILDLLRGSMMAAWLDSAWNHPVVIFEADYSRITNADKTRSVMADVCKLTELGVIFTSLIFQVRVILTTATSVQRGLVLAAAFVVAMVTMCVLLASTVVNASNIVNLASEETYALQYKMSDIAAILQLVSTGFFLAIFATKLALAIRQRKKLGQTKFGPMQIVFIGSLQSMLIPVIFTAAQWNKFVDLGSMSLTMLAIQLPLTALWASTTLEERMPGASQPQKEQKRHPIAMGAEERRRRVSSSKELGKCCTCSSSSAPSSSSDPSSPVKDGGLLYSGYKVEEIPVTETIHSLDVDVKMYESDMV